MKGLSRGPVWSPDGRPYVGAGSPRWCREDPAACRVGSEGLKQRGRQSIRTGGRGRSPRVDGSVGARRPGGRGLGACGSLVLGAGRCGRSPRVTGPGMLRGRRSPRREASSESGATTEPPPARGSVRLSLSQLWAQRVPLHDSRSIPATWRLTSQRAGRRWLTVCPTVPPASTAGSRGESARSAGHACRW